MKTREQSNIVILHKRQAQLEMKVYKKFVKHDVGRQVG